MRKRKREGERERWIDGETKRENERRWEDGRVVAGREGTKLRPPTERKVLKIASPGLVFHTPCARVFIAVRACKRACVCVFECVCVFTRTCIWGAYYDYFCPCLCTVSHLKSVAQYGIQICHNF